MSSFTENHVCFATGVISLRNLDPRAALVSCFANLTRRFPAVGCAARAAITVRDHDFIGEDQLLAAELARRLAAPPLSAPPPAYPDEIEPVYLNQSISNVTLSPETRKRKVGAYAQTPTEAHVNIMTMKLMEQACYSVQYRLKEIDHTIRKYSQDPRYRLAYMFKQLEDWEYEITMVYSYASRRQETSQFPVYRHLVYYSHCVRKMVDVTYTVEYLLVLHQQVLDSFEALEPGGGAAMLG